jgi:hypothetical protein
LKNNNVGDIFRVTQDRETPVQVFQGNAFKFRYAFARSADSQYAGDTGQDYLVFGQQNGTLVFALCDGVSLSFYGNIASRQLGDALVEWLLSGLPYTLDKETLSRSLNQNLMTFTTSATEKVLNYSLPGGIPIMLRSVLEEKRTKGSESTFVCGRLDPPGREFPEGRVVLAWLGDSRLRFWGTRGEMTGVLNGGFKTAERWSTLTGPVGSQAHLYIASLVGEKELVRFTAYTDGLFLLDRFSALLTHSEIEDLITASGESPTSDDIAYIEIITAQNNWPKSEHDPTVPYKEGEIPVPVVKKEVLTEGDAAPVKIETTEVKSRASRNLKKTSKKNKSWWIFVSLVVLLMCRYL